MAAKPESEIEPSMQDPHQEEEKTLQHAKKPIRSRRLIIGVVIGVVAISITLAIILPVVLSSKQIQDDIQVKVNK